MIYIKNNNDVVIMLIIVKQNIRFISRTNEGFFLFNYNVYCLPRQDSVFNSVNKLIGTLK